jgi:hypothetical protein
LFMPPPIPPMPPICIGAPPPMPPKSIPPLIPPPIKGCCCGWPGWMKLALVLASIIPPVILPRVFWDWVLLLLLIMETSEGPCAVVLPVRAGPEERPLRSRLTRLEFADQGSLLTGAGAAAGTGAGAAAGVGAGSAVSNREAAADLGACMEEAGVAAKDRPAKSWEISTEERRAGGAEVAAPKALLLLLAAGGKAGAGAAPKSSSKKLGTAAAGAAGAATGTGGGLLAPVDALC